MYDWPQTLAAGCHHIYIYQRMSSAPGMSVRRSDKGLCGVTMQSKTDHHWTWGKGQELTARLRQSSTFQNHLLAHPAMEVFLC